MNPPQNIQLPQEYSNFPVNSLPNRVKNNYRNKPTNPITSKKRGFVGKLNELGTTYSPPKREWCQTPRLNLNAPAGATAAPAYINGEPSLQKREFHPNCAPNGFQKQERLKKIRKHLENVDLLKIKDFPAYKKQQKNRLGNSTPFDVWTSLHYYLEAVNSENRSTRFNVYYRNKPWEFWKTKEYKYFEDHREDLRRMTVAFKEDRASRERFYDLMSRIQILEKLEFNFDINRLKDKIQILSQPDNIERLQQILERGIIVDNRKNSDHIDFLRSFGIIDQKLHERRMKVLGDNDFDSYIREIRLIFSYNVQYRVHFLLDILRQTNTSIHNKIEILIEKLKKDLIQILYQYVYFINYFIKQENRRPGRRLDQDFAWVYEGIFYGNLSYQLHFIISLLNTNDIELVSNRNGTNSGAHGEVFIQGDIAIKKLSIKTSEKYMLEFLKQVIIATYEPTYFTQMYKMVFGREHLYFYMEKIDGMTILQLLNSSYYRERNNNEASQRRMVEKLNNIHRTISNNLQYLQEHYYFIHGDFNLSNNMIVLNEPSEDLRNFQMKEYTFKMIDLEKTVFLVDEFYFVSFQRFIEFEYFFPVRSMNINEQNYWKSIDLFKYYLDFNLIEKDSKERIKLSTNNKNHYEERILSKIFPREYINLLLTHIFKFNIENTKHQSFINCILKEIAPKHTRGIKNMMIMKAFGHLLSLNYNYRIETFDIMLSDNYLLTVNLSDWIYNFIPENINLILNLIDLI